MKKLYLFSKFTFSKSKLNLIFLKSAEETIIEKISMIIKKNTLAVTFG
jgi:hypothetical protein